VTHAIRGNLRELPTSGVYAACAFSMIRIMRLFKLTRHSPGLKILMRGLWILTARTQDPHTDVQGERARAESARLLPRARHRHLRCADLLRRADAAQPAQRLHLHPGRTWPVTASRVVTRPFQQDTTRLKPLTIGLDIGVMDGRSPYADFWSHPQFLGSVHPGRTASSSDRPA